MNYDPLLTAVYTATLSGLVVSLLQIIVLPRLEQKKLRFQEAWRSKRDAFVVALQILDRHLASTNWSGPDVPSDFKPSTDKPPSHEINRSVVSLSMLSDSVKVPNTFANFFKKGNQTSPADRGNFIQMLRNELYKSKATFKADELPYFF